MKPELKVAGFCFFMIFILLVLAFSVNSCSAQTTHLKYRWDKNVEPDMSHYDLFRVIEPDSLVLWNETFWPNDTTENVPIDSAIHYSTNPVYGGNYHFATVAHIFSPIDSLMFEYDQPMEQGYLRAYICAYDSVGNVSYIGPSINAVYIGDREAPAKPGTKYLIFE